MTGGDTARRYPLAVIATLGVLVGAGLSVADSPHRAIPFGTVLALVGVPLLVKTLRDILRGRFNTDIVASLAISVSAILGEFAAGAVIALMQAGGEALEDYGLRQANRSLENLLRRAPTTAHRREDGSFVEVPASAVRAGDLLLARPGDILAADGIVVDGAGSVDESALTGEPVPLPKAPGDEVFSGTINLTGSFTYQANAAAAKSKYERIVEMVQNARGAQAPIERLADRYTPVFTVLTVVVAVLAYLVSHDPRRALSVLVVATPCPLIIATPLAVLSAINRAASLNIIAKSGAALEQIARADAVAFDKTGTLTVGTPSLVEVVAFGPVDADALCAAAAAVESRSAHVLARATLTEARRRGVPIHDPSDWVEMPGTGVAGTVDGVRWAFGAGGFLAREGIVVDPESRKRRTDAGIGGRTVAYAARNGSVVGLLCFADTLRPEAPRTIARLTEMGIVETLLITGDTRESATTVAQATGIRTVRARALPEEKQRVLAELRSAGRVVLMVGDGINDAPALASANISIAMGDHGAGIATDAADMVITVENVERVADAIAVGRRMVRVATQGIVTGIGISGFLMVLASFGWIAPSVGALLQELLDLAALVNALRARSGPEV